MRSRFLPILFSPVLLASGADSAPPVKEGAALRPAPVQKGSGEAGALDEMFGRVDPKDDAEAWSAEAFADRAGAVLKHLDAAMVVGVPADSLADEASPSLSAGALRPAELKEVFADGALSVRRGEVDAKPLTGSGAAALRAALKTWLAAYPAGTEVHTKFKIVEVQFDDKAGSAQTKAFVQSSGRTPGGIVQQSATWDCRWMVKGDEAPRISALAVTDYEEIQPVKSAAKDAPPLFADRASAVLGKTDAWGQLLVHGLDHWFKQVDAGFQIAQGYHGVCVRDVDGDDREDVFLCQPAGIHNMLFKRQPDGTLKDVSAEAGLDYLDNSRSALFVDLDNDGDADSAVSLGYEVMISENDGKGHFTPRTNVNMGSWMMSMVAADYDLDGRLDLYFCGYSPRDATAAGDLLANPVPYHDANNGARNFLIRNDGKFQFTDATRATGMDVNNRKFTNAAAWEDFDNDGDQDLYCANDFGRKNLYRNDLIKDGKRQPAVSFTDIADAAGVPDLGAGMSADWADYDRDGNMDLYVANMFSSAGRRIASQKHFKAGDTEENRAGLLRLARGNSLFRNLGDGTFEDLGESSATVLGRWAWASLFADINNDGWQDIYVCNGFYTRPDPDDL